MRLAVAIFHADRALFDKIADNRIRWDTPGHCFLTTKMNVCCIPGEWVWCWEVSSRMDIAPHVESGVEAMGEPSHPFLPPLKLD